MRIEKTIKIIETIFFSFKISTYSDTDAANDDAIIIIIA